MTRLVIKYTEWIFIRIAAIKLYLPYSFFLIIYSTLFHMFLIVCLDKERSDN